MQDHVREKVRLSGHCIFLARENTLVILKQTLIDKIHFDSGSKLVWGYPLL